MPSVPPTRPAFLIAALLLAGCAAPPPPAPTAQTAAVEKTDDWRYALVVDASSSASTLFVYRWRPGDPLPRIEAASDRREGEPWTEGVSHGLSYYADRPAEAARSLQPLIDYARRKIPASEHARTTLHLWATAGLRRLDRDRQAEILSSVDAALAATPFAAAPARVIGGEEEGVYGWLTVNYLLGHLEHRGPFPTVGALDLGGASSQITFVPLDHPRESRQMIRLGGSVYHLYTHSYLDLGQDVVREKVADPACFPRGYTLTGDVTGTGDLATCRRAIRRHLAEPCGEPPCSAFGVYQPPLYGDFLAFSTYAYTADFFGLLGRLTPRELERVGTEFCAASWPERLEREAAAAADRYLPLYCFAAAYVVELLTEGFGFSPATERVQAVLRVQGVEAGWTLGALLYELAGDAD